MGASGDLGKSARGSAILAASIISGNAINFLALPFLARIYSPENFGNFGFVISLTTIASVLVTLRLEAMIPLSSDVDRGNWLSRRVVNRAYAITLALILLLGITAASGLTNGIVVTPLELLAGIIGTFTSSLFAVGRAVHQRLDRYSIIASSAISRAATFVGTALLLSLLVDDLDRWGGACLLAASAASFLVPVIVFRAKLDCDHRWALDPGSMRGQGQADHGKRELGRISSTFILSQMSFQLPLWAAMAIYGPVAAGWVTMGYRLVMFPSDIICGSLALVLARRLATAVHQRPEQLMREVGLLKLFLLLNIALFVVLGIAVFLFAPFAFGSEWSAAALTMALLASIGLSFTIQPSVIQILGLIRRDSAVFSIIVAHVALLAAGAVIAWWVGISLQRAVLYLAVTETLLSIGLSVYVLVAVRATARTRGNPFGDA